MTRVVQVPLDHITVGARHRAQSDVSQLRESIREVGLLHPITITGDFALVAGAHRLRAARDLGWGSIAAIVMELDPLHAELAEIDENLTHHTLTVMERGEHFARRDDILRQIGLRAKSGDNRYTIADDAATTGDIAKEAGLTERTIRLDMQINRSLTPDVRDALRGTGVDNRTTDLLALSRLDENQQRQIADVIHEGRARTVSQAVKVLREPDDVEAIEEPEFTPIEGPGDDLNERKQVVEVSITLNYQASNPVMRKRTINGEERYYPRESQWMERKLEFAVPNDALAAGTPGILYLGNEVRRQLMARLSDDGWPSVKARP